MGDPPLLSLGRFVNLEGDGWRVNVWVIIVDAFEGREKALRAGEKCTEGRERINWP